ncbi:MAG: cytochrome c oxidase accessory protein CcoG [Phycisphaerales bacterium]|nr:cytochrome c oxidase accessory protein CcoG [Planctomycetota bacterium]MCH8508474.1 cytochrome c oxidase accessory protein CcoG [Phycisphaerales bacterium]
MSESLLGPQDRVLSTLNNDGSRRWLCPRPSDGRFVRQRRVVAWALIVLFTVLPHLRLNGRPLVLLDIINREFTLFGRVFLPTDTLLLALLLLIVFFTVFLVTALFGRVWCGWACPQTVYMEFVYRPIERLFEGTPGKRKPRSMRGLRKFAKFAAFLLVSMFLAHTFLAYFVGTDNLRRWILGSPHEHPIAFLVMAGTTGLMLFDFGYFREQVCIVMCPYARFQSALLDRDSLIVTYDRKRGEPRGKARKEKPGADIALPQLGDCVDCTLCVQTCPTGIDIREGLQLECIGCAQCIDACDAVMEKIGRPKGLIRYSSERAVEEGRRRLVRPRVVIYPLLLVVLLSAFVVVVRSKGSAEFVLLRERGLPFQVMASGEIANQMRIRLTNRTPADAAYTVELVDQPGLRLRADTNPFPAAAGEQVSPRMLILADPSYFDASPKTIRVRISDGAGFERERDFVIHGPRTRSAGGTREEPGDGG